MEDDIENITPHRRFGFNCEFVTEMQQQITGAGENEVLATSSSTADDNTTSPQYGFSLDNEFGKTSTFIKKLMHKYPYAEND